MLVLSDPPFYKGSSGYILYYILVEGRYSRTRVSHKSYYDQPKRSDFRKKENLENEIHKNWNTVQEHCSACYLIHTSSYDDKIYVQIV